jgi:hypothetical protein
MHAEDVFEVMLAETLSGEAGSRERVGERHVIRKRSEESLYFFLSGVDGVVLSMKMIPSNSRGNNASISNA